MDGRRSANPTLVSGPVRMLSLGDFTGSWETGVEVLPDLFSGLFTRTAGASGVLPCSLPNYGGSGWGSLL